MDYIFGDTRLPDRYWAKVVVDEGTECWLWTGAKTKGGYGQLMWPKRGSNGYAHRVIYEALVAPIPPKLQIDHLCRVRACVNPEHLEAVTGRVNLLRGETATAAHAAKTHCPAGHPYAGENLRLYTNKKGNTLRFCRACASERQRQDRIAKGLPVGVGRPADINRAKTHCNRGHPYEGDNVFYVTDKDGYRHRRCRACQKIRAQVHRDRKRLAA